MGETILWYVEGVGEGGNKIVAPDISREMDEVKGACGSFNGGSEPLEKSYCLTPSCLYRPSLTYGHIRQTHESGK